MRLCKTCAMDHECYYFFLYPFSKCECDSCKELRVCFNVNLDTGGCLA